MGWGSEGGSSPHSCQRTVTAWAIHRRSQPLYETPSSPDGTLAPCTLASDSDVAECL